MNEDNKIQFCAPIKICYSINNIPYIDIDYSKSISQTKRGE